MVTANPRIHIICGVCGSKDFMEYRIERDDIILNEGESNEEKKDSVSIICKNCATLTGLDEILQEEKK
jgi:hypothetical protein